MFLQRNLSFADSVGGGGGGGEENPLSVTQGFL